MDPHRTSLFSKGKEALFGKKQHSKNPWYDYPKEKVPTIEGDARVY
jgi:hypothetical protein